MPKRKPPSRLRYETAHPSLTVRVPAEVKSKIRAAAEAEGLSVSEWLQAQVADRVADAAETYQRGLEEGRRQGALAEAVFLAVGFLADPALDAYAAEYVRRMTPEEVAWTREYLDAFSLGPDFERWLRGQGLSLPWSAAGPEGTAGRHRTNPQSR